MATNQSSYPNPIHPSRTRIGWIGTGIMGAAMAGRIRSAGYFLTIYARTPSKASTLLSSGADLASSPASVASCCDVIFSMVGHPHDVRSVLLDPISGAVSSLSPGSVLIDCTTSDPALAREVAAAVSEKNCFSVDAPVSGGDVGARDGTLAIMAGGEKEVIEWLSPLFDLLGKVTWMGPPGSGQSSKIANQIAGAGNVVGITEGILFARKAGLDEGVFLRAIRSGAAGSKAMEIFGQKILERDFAPGGFVEYMVKDLGMALESRDGDSDSAVVLPGAALFRQMFTGMVANGDGKMGLHGLITVHERMNGMP
ncbi:putative 3-hydroxyisobutyrate dehydrogenase-like 2 [Carex littledalei]|uniref:Putative 3-hydroxyisobutyrate dehydrogenase-like 2 n=1 Tax=Carex littledalei TaxID=544730 RepID=A0A833VTQ1_9POAL|nr:putative 3-hydroxyisobutyrate dehydrogenase-like 2 [Carex littledalei]